MGESGIVYVQAAFCGLLLPDESAFGQKSESQGAQKNKKNQKTKKFFESKNYEFSRH